MYDPGRDREIAGELADIVDRLAALTSEPPERNIINGELVDIRERLLVMAEENDAVRERLIKLGLWPAQHDA